MRYFYVKITVGDSNSTFTVYYENKTSSTNIALIYDKETNTTTNATNIPYEDLITGKGVLIQVPLTAFRLILMDETDGTCSNLDFPLGPYGDINVTHADCQYGIISVTGLTGGTAPYTVFVGASAQTTYGTAVTFTDLLPGTYQVFIKGTNQTENVYRQFVEITGNTLTSSIEIVNYPSTSISTDGSLNLISSGGTYNKTYRVYKNTNYPLNYECTGTLVTTISNVTSANSVTTINGLNNGAYCLEVTDANGCVRESGLVELAATSYVPPNTLNQIRVRYSTTVLGVCSNSLSTKVYSYNQTTLTNGGEYRDINGNLLNGVGLFYKNNGILDCDYGVINEFGIFGFLGPCGGSCA